MFRGKIKPFFELVQYPIIENALPVPPESMLNLSYEEAVVFKDIKEVLNSNLTTRLKKTFVSIIVSDMP